MKVNPFRWIEERGQSRDGEGGCPAMHICNKHDTHNVVYNVYSTRNRIHTNLQHNNQYNICNMIIESNVCTTTQTTRSIHTMHTLRCVQYTLCVSHSTYYRIHHMHNGQPNTQHTQDPVSPCSDVTWDRCLRVLMWSFVISWWACSPLAWVWAERKPTHVSACWPRGKGQRLVAVHGALVSGPRLAEPCRGWANPVLYGYHFHHH